jgi:hypothetical protein
VLYPDSKNYQITETVQSILQLNGADTYLILRDDQQHISTQYLWITADWHEIKTLKPQIGNLNANSTVSYTPPVELFRIPFRFGDRWSVTSTARMITIINGTKIGTEFFLNEMRETKLREQVSTAISQTQAFKVTVTANGTLTESLWFDTDLGQVVYAEYYNENEKVTQTLIGYSLPSKTLLNQVSQFETKSVQTTQASCRKLYLPQTRLFTLRS